MSKKPLSNTDTNTKTEMYEPMVLPVLMYVGYMLI